MNMRRALVITVCMFPLAASPAAAQFQPQPAPAAAPWPDQPQAKSAAPWPGQPQTQPQAMPPAQQSPWSQPQAQQGPPANCMEEFGKLRDDAQEKATAIRVASSRKVKVSAQRACALFNAFSAAEAKMITYAGKNAARCGIPPAIGDTLKQQHVKTVEMQTNVCKAAVAGPARPAGPSLSEALGSSAIPDANNIKTGRGTFDTLTGTPLGSR